MQYGYRTGILLHSIMENRSYLNRIAFTCLFDSGGWTEAGRQRHSCDHSKPNSLHPFGGWLQTEQADQASLPGLQTGHSQCGQPGVAAHVWPAGDPGSLPWQRKLYINMEHIHNSQKLNMIFLWVGADIWGTRANLSWWPKEVHKLLR